MIEFMDANDISEYSCVRVWFYDHEVVNLRKLPDITIKISL